MTAPLPCRIFSTKMHSLKAFRFRQSPFRVIWISLSYYRMGFSSFSASCGWFVPNIIQIADSKILSVGTTAYHLLFAVAMVSANLWLPLKQFSFHPHIRLSVSAFSRRLRSWPDLCLYQHAVFPFGFPRWVSRWRQVVLSALWYLYLLLA